MRHVKTVAGLTAVYLLHLLTILTTQAEPTGTNSPIIVSLLADGFTHATSIANAGDGRLFIVQKEGIIHIVDTDGNIFPDPFLDISAQVNSDTLEQGLLGLAFHPDFAQNGFFFIDYIDLGGNSQISRFQISQSNPNQADANSELPILHIAQPHQWHNGGSLAFSPLDGYLYIGKGDGGYGFDANGQDLSNLLGTILRLDVNSTNGLPPDCGDPAAPYTIPSDNPFVDGNGNNCDEIWAYGLRNPWRTSFDPLTGDLYIGDVGDLEREEVNVALADDSGGKNYGWNCYEGSIVQDNCDPLPETAPPAHEYSHADGCAVIGGYVYRGTVHPDLIGDYFFADLCMGQIFQMEFVEGNWQVTLVADLDTTISSFGVDGAGELYVVSYDSGELFRLDPVPLPKLFLPFIGR